VAWRWSHLPELAGRELLAQGQQEDVPRGLCSILSQLAREGRLSVVEDIILEAPKTKLLADKFKAMGLDSVLVITDTVDENLYLASRNLPNVLLSSRATLIRCRWSTSRRCWSPRLRSPRSRRCWHERDSRTIIV
jgi:hypothetical protein